MVFVPVVTAYLTALIAGADKRVNRKRFFYACVINNVASVGLFLTIVVMLFFGQVITYNNLN